MTDIPSPLVSIDVGRFFDQLTGDYTHTIEKCFPRYREMLWALLEYLPAEAKIGRILELGCGTGNLSQLLCQRFPEASLHLVDLSAESIAECRKRLPVGDRIEFEQADFRDLQFSGGSFDLVISSISIHHLQARQKRELFAQVSRWLSPGGLFAFCDQFAGVTHSIYQTHVEHWRKLSESAGSTAEDWQMWMQHQAEHDHHDTLPDQMQWMRDAGLASVDCVWRYLLWGVLIGERIE